MLFICVVTYHVQFDQYRSVNKKVTPSGEVGPLGEGPGKNLSNFHKSFYCIKT